MQAYRLEDLGKSELLGKNIDEVLKKTPGSTESDIIDIAQNLDLSLCDECREIVDGCSDIRYAGHDYIFVEKIASEDVEKYNEWGLCNCCYSDELKNKRVRDIDDDGTVNGYRFVEVEDFYDDNNNGLIYGVQVGSFEKDEEGNHTEIDVSPAWFTTEELRDGYILLLFGKYMNVDNTQYKSLINIKKAFELFIKNEKSDLAQIERIKHNLEHPLEDKGCFNFFGGVFTTLVKDPTYNQEGKFRVSAVDFYGESYIEWYRSLRTVTQEDNLNIVYMS